MGYSHSHISAAPVADANGYITSVDMKVGAYTLAVAAPTFGARHVTCTRTVVDTADTAGTIVVVGDVNPGAQIVAEGDVIVWGKLRGVVHAGAAGDEDAMVGALILAPTQLRIGKQIARAPDDKRARHFPEVARVREGRIIVEPWIGSS